MAERLIAALSSVVASLLLSAPQDTSWSPADLRFEREHFTYPTVGRRDPFDQYAIGEQGEPDLEELILRGVIYTPTGEGVILMTDRGGRAYRLKRGMRIGEAVVVSVKPRGALFLIESYGLIRFEELEIPRLSMEERG